MKTRSEFVNDIALRIEKERDLIGYTQSEMADALGISLTSYKRILTGENQKVDAYVLYKLHTLVGKVDFDLYCPNDTIAHIAGKLQDLSDRQIAFIDGIVDFESSYSNGSKTEISVIVPTGNMEDGMVWDSANIEKALVPNRTGVTCGVRVTSNHLLPVYSQGDILLVSRRPIRDGDTGIFIHKPSGCAFIRRFKHTEPCQLEPINGYGNTFTVDSADKDDTDKWIKFGVVVSKVR